MTPSPHGSATAVKQSIALSRTNLTSKVLRNVNSIDDDIDSHSASNFT